MKHLIPYLVTALLGLTIAGQTRAEPGQDQATATTTTDVDTLAALNPTATDPVEWVLTISKEAAHRYELRNPTPQPMPRKLAELLVAATTDRHELALLVVYAFGEGAYSLDPELPGDCKDADGVSLPPGTPKCTKRRVEKCCAVEKASHWCTLQVEPKPASLEECVNRGFAIMHVDVLKSCAHDPTSPGCCPYSGSIYATGGSCVYNHRIEWRAKIAKHLEEIP